MEASGARTTTTTPTTRQPGRPDDHPHDASWTTRRLLGWMRERFEARAVDAPRIVAEMLLSSVLGCDRMRLYMEADRLATPEELATLRDLVRRASDHEPVQYLVGRAAFFAREFLVDPSTMIPQPCTEDLVSAVLDRLTSPRPLIADIGTGSGCIAITLAAQLPHARIIATDVVGAALDLARANAERIGVLDRVDFRAGSLLEPLTTEDGPFDAICANLPYISDAEWTGGPDGSLVQESVRRYVPESALRGGPDGLDLIRPLIEDAPRHLAPGGVLALETAHVHHEPLLALVAGRGDLVDPEYLKDGDGCWRVLVARRGGSVEG